MRAEFKRADKPGKHYVPPNPECDHLFDDLRRWRVGGVRGGANGGLWRDLSLFHLFSPLVHIPHLIPSPPFLPHCTLLLRSQSSDETTRVYHTAHLAPATRAQLLLMAAALGLRAHEDEHARQLIVMRDDVPAPRSRCEEGR